MRLAFVAQGEGLAHKGDTALIIAARRTEVEAVGALLSYTPEDVSSAFCSQCNEVRALKRRSPSTSPLFNCPESPPAPSPPPLVAGDMGCANVRSSSQAGDNALFAMIANFDRDNP